MTPPKDKLPTINSLSTMDREAIKTSLSRGATRRQVTSWLIAGGATIAAAGSIFSSATSALAATPKKGGKITFAADQHGPADSLDPVLNTAQIDWVRGRTLFNNLVQMQEDLSVKGELAEEFSANSDNTEWTFKLRRGVKFHDGSTFTADDVMYSMGRHYGDDSTSSAKALVAHVEEWVKVDEYTVKARLSGPDGDLPRLLATPHFRMAKYGVTDFSNPVGTGPFKLEEFSPGVRSIHLRNEDYWRDGPNADVIEITAITEKTARTSALITGDIDLMMALDPKAIPQVEAADGVGVWSVPSGSYYGLVMMTDREPGNNRDFVLAMKYLQNREKILRSVLKGEGTIGNDHPIGVAYGTDHCSELAQRPYDLDKAKFHLQKSGVTDVDMQVAEVRPGLNDIVLLMQSEARKIGLNLNVKKVPSDGYWGAVWMKTPMHVSAWNMRPTANIMITTAFAPDAKWNDSQWKDERIGTWLADARASTDPAKRHEIYCALQTLISEESGMIIPIHSSYIDGKSDKVEGISRVPLGPLGFSEWPEFAWRTDV